MKENKRSDLFVVAVKGPEEGPLPCCITDAVSPPVHSLPGCLVGTFIRKGSRDESDVKREQKKEAVARIGLRRPLLSPRSTPHVPPGHGSGVRCEREGSAPC